MRFVDDQRYLVCRKRLLDRRKVVVGTLAYLEGERNIAAQHGQSKNSSARMKRQQWLDEIDGWYELELAKIDAIVARLRRRMGDVDLRRAAQNV